MAAVAGGAAGSVALQHCGTAKGRNVMPVGNVIPVNPCKASWNKFSYRPFGRSLELGAAKQVACSSFASKENASVAADVARAEPVSTDEVEGLLDMIKWDSNGLAVAIAQDVDTGAILMQGFVNRDAVSATLASKRATYFSRSRQSLWTKGETSANFINVIDVYLDCDRDSIIYLGKPDGPTCHTGAETCYFTRAADILDKRPQSIANATTLYELEATIQRRKTESDAGRPSWTKRLLQDQKLLCSKIREEADELCRTSEDNEGKERTASEMADVLYHSMVLLAVQDVKLAEVMEILRARFSQSGVEEKNSRMKKPA